MKKKATNAEIYCHGLVSFGEIVVEKTSKWLANRLTCLDKEPVSRRMLSNDEMHEQ